MFRYWEERVSLNFFITIDSLAISFIGFSIYVSSLPSRVKSIQSKVCIRAFHPVYLICPSVQMKCGNVQFSVSETINAWDHTIY